MNKIICHTETWNNVYIYIYKNIWNRFPHKKTFFTHRARERESERESQTQILFCVYIKYTSNKSELASGNVTALCLAITCNLMPAFFDGILFNSMGLCHSIPFLLSLALSFPFLAVSHLNEIAHYNVSIISDVFLWWQVETPRTHRHYGIPFDKFHTMLKHNSESSWKVFARLEQKIQESSFDNFSFPSHNSADQLLIIIFMRSALCKNYFSFSSVLA